MAHSTAKASPTLSLQTILHEFPAVTMQRRGDPFLHVSHTYTEQLPVPQSTPCRLLRMPACFNPSLTSLPLQPASDCQSSVTLQQSQPADFRPSKSISSAHPPTQPPTNVHHCGTSTTTSYGTQPPSSLPAIPVAFASSSNLPGNAKL